TFSLDGTSGAASYAPSVETVQCPACHEENPAKFRLCGFCGTSLVPVPETIVCANCGEENPSKFRLCGFCGTPLAAAAAPPGATALGAVSADGAVGGTPRGPTPAPA